MNKSIAFIGAGNMTKALITGLTGVGYAPEEIIVSNPSVEKLKRFELQLNVITTQENVEAANAADIVVLAVKPPVIPDVCKEMRAVLLKRSPLIISLAVGITTAQLSSYLDDSLSIVRAMPNIPVAVQAGATGLFPNERVDEKARNQSEALFNSVGITAWVEKENTLDLVTATSGSGPAYYFLMIEAMQNTAEKMGLSVALSRSLSLQTIVGAAKMALETETDFKDLRRSVTSPHGTTDAAIKVFEAGALRDLFKKAMEAAFHRAQELSGL